MSQYAETAKTIADALQRLAVANQSETAKTIADALQKLKLVVAIEQDVPVVEKQDQQPILPITPQERLLANFNAALHPSPTALSWFFKGISIIIVVGFSSSC